MTETQSERAAIVEWFESDFKEAAKATTKTSRLQDGTLSYSFAVVNDSGFDFDKFAFRIKVINKGDGSEIGTALINAGSWASGEKKNFRSKLAIPADAKSLSFVMYSNSLDYELKIPYEFESAIKDVTDAVDNIGEVVRGVGEAITGADGSGGVFGELFGTGGMPETQGTTVTKTTTTKTANGTTTTRTTTTTTSKPKTSGTVNAGGARPVSGSTGNAARTRSGGKTFTQRKNEKRLNKKRLGKSGWVPASVITGVVFLTAAAGAEGDTQFMIECGAVGIALMAIAAITKLVISRRAKRIRAYEAKINPNGNTSLDDLAAYVGKPFNKVADELQQMIVDGFFGEAYVDIDNRLLVMTRNGEPIESVERSAAINKKARRKAARDDSPESLDDLITMTDDPDIRAGLKKLRTITKKIDARVEQVPDLEKQVSEFREKFYPEVVRLTDQYNDRIADMGSYGSEGSKAEVTESASGAPVINSNPNYLEEQAGEIKEQLISLIDSVTEASENLLERLHEDDIMDITTDIRMLQTTLASKGLLDSDFDL